MFPGSKINLITDFTFRKIYSFCKIVQFMQQLKPPGPSSTSSTSSTSSHYIKFHWVRSSCDVKKHWTFSNKVWFLSLWWTNPLTNSHLCVFVCGMEDYSSLTGGRRPTTPVNTLLIILPFLVLPSTLSSVALPSSPPRGPAKLTAPSSMENESRLHYNRAGQIPLALSGMEHGEQRGRQLLIRGRGGAPPTSLIHRAGKTTGRTSSSHPREDNSPTHTNTHRKRHIKPVRCHEKDLN